MHKKNAPSLLVIAVFVITSFMVHQVRYFGSEEFKRLQLIIAEF
jgi:hypothetical protein